MAYRIRHGIGVVVFLAMAGLYGCATPPTGDPESLAEYKEANDPAEPTNRVVFSVNDTLDEYFFEPAARGYRKYVPQFVRHRLHDFFTNLGEPLVFVNDVLQAEGTRAGESFGRFILNSTTGLVGLFDLAGQGGTPHHESDFGMTLAVWGAPEGPYLVLPLFGPSNVRDGTGRGVDWFMDPIAWVTPKMPIAAKIGKNVVAGVDERSIYLDELADIKKTSIDYYASMRSLYRQRRNSLIKGDKGSVPDMGISYEDTQPIGATASLP